MEPIEEKQWRIKRTDDYLKHVIEDIKNRSAEQDTYNSGKLKAISNVRGKLLAGVASVITIIFGLSGANILDSSQLFIGVSASIAIGILIFSIYSCNKFILELKLSEVSIAGDEMIEEFNNNLKYFIDNTRDLETSNLESISAFHLYFKTLENAVRYYYLDPYSELIKSKFIQKELRITIQEAIETRKKTEDAMFELYKKIDKDKLPMDCQLNFKRIIDRIKPHLERKDYFKEESDSNKTTQ